MAARRSVSPLGVRREGALVFATLRRPPDNRIDRALAAALRDLCGHLREEGEARLLIITAEGEAFCRGAGHALQEEAQRARSLAAITDLLGAYRCADAVAALPFPVLAAIEGDAFDQGMELALAADLRIAGVGASFRLGRLAEGLIPWDGGTQRLPRVAGLAHAADLILTGRIVDTAEAERMGLVDRLVPAGQALVTARAVAEQVLAGGPIAARYAKEAVHKGMEMTLEQGILLETDLTMVLQTTADRTEGIRSFLERRKPQFKGE